MAKIKGTDLVGNPLTNLTYNEVHSMILGLLGVFAGIGAVNGFGNLVAYGSLLLIAIMFGFNSTLYRIVREKLQLELPKTDTKAADSKASTVIASEPWYFTSSYVFWFIVSSGFLLFVLPDIG